MNKKNIFTIWALILNLLFILLIYFTFSYIYIQNRKKTGNHKRNSTIDNRLNYKIFFDKNFGKLRNNLPKSGQFETSWDYNTPTNVSRSIYQKVEMDGINKYKMIPNKNIFNGRIWDGLKYNNFTFPIDAVLKRDLDNCSILNYTIFKTNSFGYKETINITEPIEHDIMFIGDSFTEGLFINPDQTFAGVFSNYISKNYNINVKSHNMGVTGYSPLEYLYTIKEYSSKIHPEYIIVNLFSNDVDYRYWKVIRGKLDLYEQYNVMFNYLDQIVKYCDSNKIILILSLIPTRLEIHSTIENAFYKNINYWATKKNIVINYPREYLKNNGSIENYFSWDPHFSELGHKNYAIFLSKVFMNIKKGIN